MATAFPASLLVAFSPGYRISTAKDDIHSMASWMLFSSG
jgi:hypothetical protein